MSVSKNQYTHNKLHFMYIQCTIICNTQLFSYVHVHVLCLYREHEQLCSVIVLSTLKSQDCNSQLHKLAPTICIVFFKIVANTDYSGNHTTVDPWFISKWSTQDVILL